MTLRALASLAIFIIVCSMPARACSLSDFVIKQADWLPGSPLSNLSKVVGEVTNNCDQAAGVELKFVFRNDAGKVTGIIQYWPTRQNIPAHSDYPFVLAGLSGEGAKTMQSSVSDVRKWEPSDLE